MQIENYRYIKSLQLPLDWRESEPSIGGLPNQIVRTFSPNSEPDVHIELFYRGFSISEQASQTFRKILQQAPQILYDYNRKDNASIHTKTIEDLEEVLGNAGNNQIANKQNGFYGPSFILHRLEALIWNNKPLLALRGVFIDPEEGNELTQLCNFFLDATPHDTKCGVEEIYLEAPNERLMRDYLPVFQESLKSIEWAS